MPYKTTWEEKGIYWEFFGTVTMAEVIEANDEFYASPKSDTARYQLFDGLGITELIATEGDVKVQAARDKGSSRSIPNILCALVFNKPELIAMAEVYADYTRKLESSWRVGVFQTLEEARDWLKSLLTLEE